MSFVELIGLIASVLGIGDLVARAYAYIKKTNITPTVVEAWHFLKKRPIWSKRVETRHFAGFRGITLDFAGSKKVYDLQLIATNCRQLP
jgi:hypothetical protein